MKVVLFCGGLGTRLREHSDTIPKPLVNIGYRPILWHLMRYYAHFGHKDFILCLGYRGDLIREYFLNYNECMSNDFVLSEGGRKIELLRSDIEDWRITFVDTGLHSNIGQRLLRVRQYLRGRGDVPRQLRRRPVRPAAATTTSTTSERARRDRQLRWPCARRRASTRRRSTTTALVTRIGPIARRGILDQRRLLRAAPGDLRLHRAKARNWSRSRSSA